MKRFFISILLLTWLSGETIAQNATDTICDVQMSVAAFENNNLDSAKFFIAKALTQRQNYQRFMFSGYVFMKNAEYKNAITAFRNAEKSFSDCALLPLTECYSMENNIDSAFYFLEKYSQKNNKLPLQQITSDSLLQNLKQSEKWNVWLKKITYQPLETELFTAEYNVKKQRTSQAMELLNKIIKKYPSNHKAFYLRANAYCQDGNLKSALQDIQRAVKLRPRESQYIEYQANILSLEKKYSQAAELYLSALKVDEFAIKNYYNAAKNYYLANEIPLAKKYIKCAVKLFSNNEKYLMLYAEIMLNSDDPISALKIVNSIDEQKKSTGEFYRLRGLCYLKTETYNYAITDFTNALDLNPSLTDIYLHRGMAYYQLGEKEKAHADWNNALNKRLFQANNYLQKYR